MTKQKKKKILLVEDERLLGEMYKKKMEDSGYEVFWIRETEEAFDIIGKENPDLILLDILLPNKNGTTFLKELRQDEKYGLMPVIVFSNFDDPETKREAIGLEIVDYLIKTNYTPNEIIERINAFFN